MMNDNIHFSKKVNGISIYYEFYQGDPTKPVVVLVHGFLSSTFSFRKLIPFLVKNYSVIAIDLPPFGKSGKVKNFVYSYHNMAQVVIELLTSLKLDRVILIGHSMGGQIALSIAKSKPQIVSNVVLLSSSGYMKRLKKSVIFATYIPFFPLFMKYWLAKTGVMANLRNVVYDHSLIDDDMVLGYSEPFNDNKIFVGLTRFARYREGDLSKEDLATIKVPCLLLWGEEDRVVPIKIGKQLRDDLQNTTFISFSKTGHLVPEEQPKLVYDEIVKFVNE